MAGRAKARGWWAAALASLGVAPGALALGLTEAVTVAVNEHPAVAGAQAGVTAARAEADATGKGLRPILRTEAGVQLWAEEQVLNLGGGSGGAAALPPPTTPYENVVAGLVGSLGQPMTVRELVTANVRVQIIQPLSDLWRISLAQDVAEQSVDAARLQTEGARRQVAAGVAEAYLRVLQARSLAATAEAGVQALQAQESAAAALVEGGLMAPTTRLQIEVARRAAEQDVLAARNAEATARAALGMAMGRPVAENVPLEESLPAWAEAPVPDLAAAVSQALAADPDLQRAEVVVRQAEGGGWTSPRPVGCPR